ncbi:CPBP family intramembrane glutamic endopeptidase [Chengkuizengella marina]|uniref:CPBP family intramembrane metalloprotease n=1 Tax=Chengkuizengella marina TaxID=2507566 RepID=A0A6N9PWL1_9BACL|nr:CPBP family intramembrane glutamic endopeptidase [Chengkuizengella marina]NBI27909.1 CPBP family intramembrane metalloprotease [Chengkuizengella marina]
MSDFKKTVRKTKDFHPKDAIRIFVVYTLILIVTIFIFINKDVLSSRLFFSFHEPIYILLSVIITSIVLLLYSMVLAYYIPSKWIDDTNKSYQKYSLFTLFYFMFFVVLFEELLFRGLIQNLIFITFNHAWLAIIITTLLFIGFHTRYFKKPIMLINIAFPSLVFSWIYFQTHNIFVPFAIHWILNVGMTLGFKYNLIKLK